jgi:dipeptidase E
MGGGGFSMEPDNSLLDEFVLAQSRAPEHPRVCFLPTASGDSERYVALFYRAFSRLGCQPSDLQLFERRVSDLESFVLSQDVVYVGGGNTANLLAVWRVHGLDRILRRAWEEGVLLCGLSAGMNCWFESSVTDSFDTSHLRALHDGLGLVRGSACPHYDGEDQRRPVYRQLVASGELAAGWAADDGAAIVFRGEEMAEVVASRPEARAYRVERTREDLTESSLAARYLG